MSQIALILSSSAFACLVGFYFVSRTVKKDADNQRTKNAQRESDLLEGLVEPRTPREMKWQHNQWLKAGILDEDQPTAWSHHLDNKKQSELKAEFSPNERQIIRMKLGIK